MLSNSRYLKHLRDIASEQHTRQADIQEMLLEREEKGKIEGKREGKIEVARSLIDQGVDDWIISNATGLSELEIQKLREGKSP
jgi:predicted transposase/invertase (TIGR01784 family)